LWFFFSRKKVEKNKIYTKTLTFEYAIFCAGKEKDSTFFFSHQMVIKQKSLFYRFIRSEKLVEKQVVENVTNYF